MKKIFTILAAMTLALSLCGCPANNTETVAVHITAGKIEPGMTVKDVVVNVTVNNQPVACRVKLTGFVWDGYWEMEEDEPIPEPYAVRVDIFYSLPKGLDVEDVNITAESDGGNYDGTGSISFDDDGNIEAWSRIFYGKEPLPPETESSEEPEHTHDWVEQPGPGIVVCTEDVVKSFKCSCGETKTETIPAPGHNLKAWSETPATCTDDGLKTTSCKRCGAGFTVDIPATGHTWTAWEKETGLVHKRTCTVCGEEETAKHNIPSGEVTCTDCGADIIN